MVIVLTGGQRQCQGSYNILGYVCSGHHILNDRWLSPVHVILRWRTCIAGDFIITVIRCCVSPQFPLNNKQWLTHWSQYLYWYAHHACTTCLTWSVTMAERWGIHKQSIIRVPPRHNRKHNTHSSSPLLQYAQCQQLSPLPCSPHTMDRQTCLPGTTVTQQSLDSNHHRSSRSTHWYS